MKVSAIFIRYQLVCLALLCGISVFGTNANAGAVKVLEWKHLVPGQSAELKDLVDKLQSEMDALNKEQREAYFKIEDEVSLKNRVQAGFIDKERLLPDQKALLNGSASKGRPELKALYDRMMDARKKVAEDARRVEASLDGTTVRIPGYVLPLEMEGSQVREFLLVPFVGACIHVPPPPPNQMVFVEAKKPFSSDSLYEAVWVEGVLSTQAGSHQLSLTDGQGKVSTGYSLTAVKVTKHKP